MEFAKVLNINTSRKDGYLEADNWIITWCVGHLVTMSYPEKYDEKLKFWRLDTLPFIPEEYKYEVIPSVQKQFNTIQSLLTREDVSTIYVATDSGREGEYIYRLVEQMIGVKNKDRKRVWIDSQTEEEIKRGIREAKDASDVVLTMGLEAVADGADPTLVQAMMENQIAQQEEEVHTGAKVFESAGGYSPTLGIIGAVMGLIQVMQNLSDPSALGAGIAVAFVATIYGLFAANLLLIPLGTRIKLNYAKVFLGKEIMVEGVLAIQAGESPALIERKLQAYIVDRTSIEEDEE